MKNALDSGKKKRMQRIFRDDKRTVIIPMDHGTSLGPVRGLHVMQETVSKLLEGGADAVVLNSGIAKHTKTGRAGLIVHLSGGTKYGPDPHRKVQVCSVLQALRVGADAVSVHINVGSQHEEEMLTKLSRVVEDCDDYGVPLLAMMYPRGPRIKDEHALEVVAHVARLGAELGADIIKTNYTGTVETFREVVQSCHVPVVIAGGPKAETTEQILQMAYDSTKAGGAGLSIGRNVFQHQNPTLMVKVLIAIVHDNVPVNEALKMLGENK